MSYEVIKIRNTDDGIRLVPVTLKGTWNEKEQETVISIQMFSDVSCPWCFLADRFLESVQYDIQIEYIEIEQHPDVPVEGKRIEPGSCLKNTIRRINQRGKEYGLEIPEIRIGPNTHKALLIGEYAKRIGKQDPFVKKTMWSYFMDGRNISNPEILEEIAASVGIDEGWKTSINELESALAKNRELADLYKIYSVPSFIINSTYLIRGMDDERLFEEVFQRVI